MPCINCSKLANFFKVDAPKVMQKKEVKAVIALVIGIALVLFALLLKQESLGGVRKHYFARAGLILGSLPFLIYAGYSCLKPRKGLSSDTK